MADFVILRFERKDMSAMRLRTPLLALEQMITSAAAVREFAGRVRVVFDGYEGAVEAFTDPDAQRFIRELTDLFPYWLHFADKGDDTLRVLMCCLRPPQRAGDGDPSTEIDVSAWSDQLARLHHYMIRLHAQFGLLEVDHLAIREEIIAWMQRNHLPSAVIQSDK